MKPFVQLILGTLSNRFCSVGAAVFLILICPVIPALVHGAVPDPTREVTLKELEFKDAQIQDAVRVISELTGVNIVATRDAGKKMVTLFVRNLTVADIVDSICRISGLWYRFNPDTGIFIIMTTEEYQRDIVVFRYEPTRMFQLEYLNVGIAARTIADLFGDRVELMGKADRYYGDDFEVGDTMEDFEEEVDEGTMDSSTRSSSSGRSSSSSRTNEKRPSLETGSLTANQLALLQTGEGAQAVSEGKIRQVSQRTESSIYVTVNRLHNMLFVRTADEKAMEEIARIIKESDRRVPEVLLEMKVLEVQLTDQFQSAFDISNISGSEQSGPDDGRTVNPLNGESATVGSSLLGLGNFDVLGDSTMVFQALSGNLRMRLQLLQENNNIESLATPMLLAANNHPARLFIGEETVLTTGFTTQTVQATNTSGVVVNNYVPVPETETREIGNTLTILPSINADRSVVMRIVHENSSVNQGGGSIPLLVGDAVENVSIDTVTTSELEGTVLAQDGMTVAVGGMMRTSYTDTESKVPILGDIPGLGFFFKQQAKNKVKTELILLITPHVLSAPAQGEAVSRERLKELSSHPNDLDVYLDSLDRSRAAKKGANSGLAGPDQGGLPVTSNSLQESFKELIQTAAVQIRQPLLLRQPQGRIRPVLMKPWGRVPIFAYQGIVSKPEAAWTDGTHFITALKVTNLMEKSTRISTDNLNGSWKSSALEAQELAPAGKEGDSTYLYLISEKNFETSFVQEP